MYENVKVRVRDDSVAEGGTNTLRVTSTDVLELNTLMTGTWFKTLKPVDAAMDVSRRVTLPGPRLVIWIGTLFTSPGTRDPDVVVYLSIGSVALTAWKPMFWSAVSLFP